MSARRTRMGETTSDSDPVTIPSNTNKNNNKEGIQDTIDFSRDRSGSRRGRRRTASIRTLRGNSNSNRDLNSEQKTPPVVYRRHNMISPGGSQSLANTPTGTGTADIRAVKYWKIPIIYQIYRASHEKKHSIRENHT